MGNIRDTLDVAKSAGSAIESTEHGKEARENIGRAALTVTKTINNALLPLAALNFGFEKARNYFTNKFSSDLEEKTEGIPPEHLTEPKASVAGPALQGLAFSHDEAELREMYLELIACSMDDRIAKKAHPAFVEIIKQLGADEARLLQGIISTSDLYPIAEIRLVTEGMPGHMALMKHVLPLVSDGGSSPAVQPELPAMVDNWIRLGLVEVDYSSSLANEERYKWVEGRPELEELRNKYFEEKYSVVCENGYLVRTQFGSQFAEAVGVS